MQDAKLIYVQTEKAAKFRLPPGSNSPWQPEKATLLKKSIAIGEEFVKYIRASPYIAPAPLSE